jgi:hypothetical protein
MANNSVNNKLNIFCFHKQVPGTKLNNYCSNHSFYLSKSECNYVLTTTLDRVTNVALVGVGSYPQS